MPCIFIIKYAKALNLVKDHTVYSSFHTANRQLIINRIRLAEICLNYTFIYYTRETNAITFAETLCFEHTVRG